MVQDSPIAAAGQTQDCIGALRFRVVELIRDLNGKHVIQKCLNRYAPLDAQFILVPWGLVALVLGGLGRGIFFSGGQ